MSRCRLFIVCVVLGSGASVATAEQPASPASGAAPASAPSSRTKGSGEPGAAATGDPAPHVLRAREYFQDQKYTDAAEELQRAYVFDPKPLYLFNAGQAYRKAEKRKEAVEMYKRYLSDAPDGSLALEARGHVTDLEALIKAQENLENVTLRLESERSELENQKRKAVQIEEALKKERQKHWYKHPAFIVAISTVGVFAIIAGLAVGVTQAQARTDGNTLVVNFPNP